GQLGVEGAEEAGRNHVHIGEGGRAGGGEEVGPLELGRERLELGERHLVVDGGGVAAGDVIHRALRQGGLDAQDGGGFGGGLGGGVAEQGEHLGHVGLVLPAQGDGFGVGLEIVVAVGEAQSALVGFSDDLVGVLEVLVGAEAEGDVGAIHLQAGDLGGELGGGLDAGEQIELGLEGLGAGGIDRGLVHAGGVVVADLLGDGVFLGGVGAGVLENLVKGFAVALDQLGEGAPLDLIVGDGMLRHPGAASVLVEVLAGIGGGINGREIGAGGLGRGRGRTTAGGEEEGGSEERGGEAELHDGKRIALEARPCFGPWGATQGKQAGSAETPGAASRAGTSATCCCPRCLQRRKCCPAGPESRWSKWDNQSRGQCPRVITTSS